MKKLRIYLPVLMVICFAFNLTSCKGKTDSAAVTTVDTSAANRVPVVVSTDDALKKGVMDATKDYPNLKADVTDGEINLTGEIKRADWQKLNPTLNSLHPKRVNSANLTIK